MHVFCAIASSAIVVIAAVIIVWEIARHREQITAAILHEESD